MVVRSASISWGFRQYATKTAANIKSRNNIIGKLAGTNSPVLCGRSHCAILLLSAVFLHEAVLLTSSWSTGNLMTCASSQGLYVQLHCSGFQYYPTLLLQPSNVLKQLFSSSITFRPNHSFLFTRTSRLQSCRPIWSIDTVSSMEKLWTETREADPSVHSYIIEDPTVSGVFSIVSALTLGDV